MKRKNLVKLTAVATAAAMALSPATVFAADSADGDISAGSSIEGSGNLEGIVDKDVFKVKLPTTAAGDTNFILDPQGLLKIADASKYKIGAGAIYFKNKDAAGGADTYSNTSDAIEIINKSSYDIDVAFSVKVELPEGVQMVKSEDALANATAPSIYLEMKESEDTAGTALKAGENIAEVKLVDKVPEAAGTGYEIKATAKADGSGYDYTYELGASFDETAAEKASYTLTGKCDTVADWSAVNELEDDKKTVKTTIVWSAKKHEDYTDKEANGNWNGGALWLSKDGSEGFSTTGLVVEVSDGGTTYKTLTSDKYTIHDSGWVSTTWDNIVAGIGSEPTGTAFVRVIDGSTRYTFEN